jgi:spermidine synthase
MPILVSGLVFSFFATGVAALLYQVIWQRMLVLYTGSDVQSAALVTSAYLTGLGIGSWVSMRLADRLSARRALQLFGIANCLIGLFAIISPWLLHHVFYLRTMGMSLGPLWMWIEIFVALAFPTALMGISLPMASRAAASRLKSIPSLVSVLNGSNMLGAATGCLAGAIWLTPAFGFEQSLHIGAAISLMMGPLIFALSTTLSDVSPPIPETRTGTVSGMPGNTHHWAVLFFLSGFLAIALQMVWLRISIVITGQNPLVYAVMLGCVLFFDGVGSLLAIRLRWSTLWRTFLLLQVLIVIWSVWSIWFLPAAVINLPFPWPQLLPVMQIVPAALLIGAGFPVIHRAVHHCQRRVGERVGLIETANITGNALAGIVTGLVLLEWWGTTGVFHIVIGLGAFFAILLVIDLLKAQPLTLRAMAACTTGVIAYGVYSFFPDQNAFWKALHYRATASTNFYVAEKASGVSAFLQSSDGRTEMQVNGHYQGEIPLGNTGQLYLGMLPALLHPDPRTVLLIGLGSGATAYGTGARESIMSVTVIELVSAQYPLHRDLLEHDPDPALASLFSDSRYRWIDGDGRRLLASDTTRYDIIEADAMMPTTSGAGFLYSVEFFNLAKSRLKPGGLVAQWNPSPRTERTFMASFPYVTKLKGDLLIGSNEPIRIDMGQLQALLQSPFTNTHLARAGLGETYLATLLDNLLEKEWTPDNKPQLVSLNFDWWPKDEYSVPE